MNELRYLRDKIATPVRLSATVNQEWGWESVGEGEVANERAERRRKEIFEEFPRPEFFLPFPSPFFLSLSLFSPVPLCLFATTL